MGGAGRQVGIRVESENTWQKRGPSEQGEHPRMRPSLSKKPPQVEGELSCCFIDSRPAAVASSRTREITMLSVFARRTLMRQRFSQKGRNDQFPDRSSYSLTRRDRDRSNTSRSRTAMKVQ